MKTSGSQKSNILIKQGIMSKRKRTCLAGINGFGRIGRIAFRCSLEKSIEVVAINGKPYEMQQHPVVVSSLSSAMHCTHSNGKYS